MVKRFGCLKISLRVMPIAGRVALSVVLCCSAMVAACSGGMLKPQYEYEEELYLDLDGSATLNLNASVPALVALHGVDLPTDPRARIDRDKIRALFTRPGSPAALSVSRRDGRRYVHVSVEVPDVRQLSTIQPFSWSTYEFTRDNDRADYHQVVGSASAKATVDKSASATGSAFATATAEGPAGKRNVGDVGWDGSEVVAFRMHIPSEILFENSDADVRRGNILEWEQPLSSRLQGEPLDLRVQMAPESILYNTLLLFGSTIVAAVAAFAAVLWWIARRGRQNGVSESPA